MSATISVITPWLDHPELIADYESAVHGAQVVIVDNGSQPAVAAQLDALAERLGNGSRVLHNPTNDKFAKANNQAFPHATGDIIVFLNNDVSANGSFLLLVANDVIDSGLLYGPEMIQASHGLYLSGWCIAGQRAAWEKLVNTTTTGKLWHEFPGMYYEDNELCHRAQFAARLGLVETAWPIRHLSNTTSRTTAGAYDHVDQNRAEYLAIARFYTPPLLTVVTRHLPHRSALFAQNRASLEAQTDPDYEQLVLTDTLRVGIENANLILHQAADMVRGDYVWVLDDDDVCADPEFIAKLKAAIAEADTPPDVVMVRMEHAHLGIKPPDELWNNQAIALGQVGISAAIVRRPLWQQHAQYYARGYDGDFEFYEHLFRDDQLSVLWLDMVASRCLQIGRGA